MFDPSCRGGKQQIRWDVLNKNVCLESHPLLLYTLGVVIFVMHYSNELLFCFTINCSSALACVAKSSRGDCEVCVAQSVVACVAQP